MKALSKNALFRYALGFGLLGLALPLSAAAHRVIPNAEYYLFLAAVIAASWLGGRGPGLMTAVLAPLTVDYFFLPPLYTFGISAEARPYIVPFLLAAMAAAWAGASRNAASEAKASQLRDHEKFRRLLTNLPDVTWTADQHGNVIYISPKVEKVLGYSKKEILQGGLKFLMSRTHSDDFARVQSAAEALFVRQEAFDVEFRFQRKDGTWVWVHNRAIGAYEENGLILADGVVADVSARKQAEVELREKSAFLEAQINANVDGILVIDANGRRIQQNQRVVEMFDIPAELLANPDQIPVREHMLLKVRDPQPLLIEQLYRSSEETGRYEFDLIDGTFIDMYSAPVKSPAGEYFGRIWTFRDITERKRSEGELKSKAAFLETLLNSTVDGILVVDQNGQRAWTNQRFIEYFAVPPEIQNDPSDAPLLRHVVQLAKNPEQYLARVKYLNEHSTETGRDELEFKDGRVFDRYSAPVVDQDGNYYGRVRSFRDITERKRNEMELRSKTALLEAQVNSTIDGILVVDESDRRILINERFIEFFRVPAEILNDPSDAPLLRHILQLVRAPEPFLAKIRYLNEHTAETGRDEIEFKDGRVFDRYSAPVIDKDQNYYGRVWSFRDITERKRNENALRQLSAAVDQSPVTVVITDPSGDITYVNPKFTSSTGYTFEEAAGKNPRILNSGYAQPEMYQTLWNNILQGKEWHGEFQNRKKNGELYWEAAVITPILDAAGTITSFLAVKEDITERRAMESELRQAQKLEGIGQLAAGIAHEINTPIQFVTDNFTFLRESWEAILPLIDRYRTAMSDTVAKTAPEAAAELTKAEEACDLGFIVKEVPRAIDQGLDGARRVASIVRAMKEFSHPDSADKANANLNRGILSTITVARNEWKYVAEVETDLDESLPPVICYPGEINQVILNLIVNAAHAIKDRVADGEKGKITIKTRKHEAMAEIAVSDTGMGIPEEIQSRIYEPFFTTKEVGKGTGQGLSFAHSVVVKKHQGKLWFETEAGVGTTFFIQIPICQPDELKESDAQTSAVCR